MAPPQPCVPCTHTYNSQSHSSAWLPYSNSSMAGTIFSWAHSSRPSSLIPILLFTELPANRSDCAESKSVVFLLALLSNPSTPLASHSSFPTGSQFGIHTRAASFVSSQPVDGKGEAALYRRDLVTLSQMHGKEAQISQRGRV